MSKDLQKGAPSPVQLVREMLEKHKTTIAKVAVNRLKADQLVSVAMQHMVSNPKLIECDPLSIAAALVNASRLGLTPDPALRQCGLVPRWSKHAQRMLCHLWIQAGGWVQLVKRAGEGVLIEAHTVHQNDEFDYEYGTNKFLRHKIVKSRSQRGEFTHSYAIAYFRHDSQFQVLDREDVERLRQQSDAKDGPFWTKWYDEMAQAKAGKALCKWLQISSEQVQLAVGLDDQMDAGVRQTSPIDTPVDTNAAARQAVEKKVDSTGKAAQQAREIDQNIISIETQQAVLDAAHKAGVRPGQAVNSMLDIQTEATDQTGQKTQREIYQGISARIAKLIQVYNDQYVERERQRKQRTDPIEQAKAPPAPHYQRPARDEAPLPEERNPPATQPQAAEHPWISEAAPPSSQPPPPPKTNAAPYDASDIESIAGMFD